MAMGLVSLFHFRFFCNTTGMSAAGGACPFGWTSSAGSSTCFTCLSQLSVPLRFPDPAFQVISRPTNLRFEVATSYSISNACFNSTPLLNLSFVWKQLFASNLSNPSPSLGLTLAKGVDGVLIGNQSVSLFDVATDSLGAAPLSSRYVLYFPGMTLQTNRTYGSVVLIHCHSSCLHYE